MQRAYASRKNSSCFLLSQMPYSVPPPAPTRPPMSAPLPPLAMAPPAAPTAAPPSAPIPASLPTSTSLPFVSRPAPLWACACWLQESTTDWGGVLDWATRRAGVSLAGAVVAGGWGRVAASSDVRGLAAGGCSTLAVTGSELQVVRRATTTPVITAVTAATATPIAVIFQRFSRLSAMVLASRWLR